MTYKKALKILNFSMISLNYKIQIENLIERLNYYGLVHNRQDKILQAEELQEKLNNIKLIY